MPLIIVESPSKCSKIQSFLPSDWKVVATMGHIQKLKPHIKSVGIDNNFEPVYEWIQKKSIPSLVKVAKSYSNSDIYLASDDDREGEFIAYSLCVLLNLDIATTPRIVFHEITQTAILEAIAHPRHLNENVVKSQQTRTLMDMLIGFTISPLLWKNIDKSSLSAGRCQTPALRLIVDREKEQSNTKEQGWKIKGEWKYKSSPLSAHIDTTLSETQTTKTMDVLKNSITGIIENVKVSDWTRSSPPPLITSSLQQKGYSYYSLPPQKTMQIAQKLYEEGHITYMRTDSTSLSEEAKNSINQYIHTQFGQDYIRVQCNKLQKGAHEAIRPTHIEVTELQGHTNQENNIYKLIWKYAVQTCMSDAYGKKCQVRFSHELERKHKWISTAETTEFEGWKRLAEKTEPDDSNFIALSKTKEGDLITYETIEAIPELVENESRFTEASLVKELEKRGIGRPSTYTNIVESNKKYYTIQDFPKQKIQSSKYSIEKDKPEVYKVAFQIEIPIKKKQIVPNVIGGSVSDFLNEHFSDLFGYDFTSEIETKLDKISLGEQDGKVLLTNLWNSYKDRCTVLKKNKLVVKEERMGVWKDHALVRKKGRYGYYVIVEGTSMKISVSEEDIEKDIIRKIENKMAEEIKKIGPYELRVGKYGPYMYKTDLKRKRFVSISAELFKNPVLETLEQEYKKKQKK